MKNVLQENCGTRSTRLVGSRGSCLRTQVLLGKHRAIKCSHQRESCQLCAHYKSRKKQRCAKKGNLCVLHANTPFPCQMCSSVCCSAITPVYLPVYRIPYFIIMLGAGEIGVYGSVFLLMRQHVWFSIFYVRVSHQL